MQLQNLSDLSYIYLKRNALTEHQLYVVPLDFIGGGSSFLLGSNPGKSTHMLTCMALVTMAPHYK